MNRREPGRSIGVGQRPPLLHRLDVRIRMQRVGIEKRAVQRICQHRADCGLSRSCDAHYNDNHQGSCDRWTRPPLRTSSGMVM